MRIPDEKQDWQLRMANWPRGKTQQLVNYMRRGGDQREDSRRCIFLFLSFFYFALSPHSIQATQNHKWILSSRYPAKQEMAKCLGAEAKSRASDVFAWGHRDCLTPVWHFYHKGMLPLKGGSWSATCWCLFEKRGLRVRKALTEKGQKFLSHTHISPCCYRN